MTSRNITGVINSDYGDICRGITRLEPLEVDGQLYRRTRVEWGSSLPQDGRKLEGEFIFYEELPDELMRKMFNFEEIPSGTEIPLSQILGVFGFGDGYN